MLLVLGLAASGEVEAACMAGRYYRPEDLSRLIVGGAGATGRAKLEKVVADVWFWMICQRRQPMTGDPSRVPGAKAATEQLAKLEGGARLFGLAAQ